MKVTQIQEVSKSRSKIFLDEEFAFVLYKGELRHYQIQQGEELSEEDYNTILNEVLPKRAKLRCMNLLKSKDYTEEQLKQKLRQGGYPKTVIEEALQYVSSYHYIDDLRYAVNYITCHEGSKSRRRIEQDLQTKGISKEILIQAFQEWEDEGGAQDEIAMIHSLLQKKHFNPETTDYKERQRISGFLARKGYSVAQIRKAMKMEEDWE